MLLTLVYWIGVLKLAFFLYKICRYYYLNYKKQDFKTRYGDGWAIVTGTTNGIGKQLCLSLAKKGFNLVLISRDQNKLHELEKQIKVINPQAQVKILIADFVNSLIDKTMFQRIEEKIKDLDISIFINNAGVLQQGELVEANQTGIRNQLVVNQIPMIYFLKMVIPLIKKHIQITNKKGAIVNIASIAGVYPLPNQSVYNGTKAFNDFFSQSVGLQYQDQKIDYLTVRPSVVTTNMTAVVEEFVAPIAITTKTCVEGIWRDLGVLSYGYPSFFHKLQGWAASISPEAFQIFQANESRKVNQKRKQKIEKKL